MKQAESNRLLRQQSIENEIVGTGKDRATTRSVTVNVAESPLGWLFSRGLVSQRQFDAGERLSVAFDVARPR